METSGTGFKKFAVVLLPVIVVLAAACGDSAAAPAPSSSDSLDADAIVAAQGEVLNRIYQELLPSVVHIDVYQRVDGPSMSSLFPFPFGSETNPQTLPDPFIQGEGSGFVWSEDGHIVTSHHVIEDAERVTVTFADGSVEEAEILGSDPDSDLAVLKLAEPSGQLGAVTLGDSGDAMVGELVAAIGSPFGRDFTLTSGIVSAAGRTIRSGSSAFSVPGVIQTDAAINPGSSGGPLIDRMGRVIGINTQIASSSGANAGVGFAVPINTAKRVIPELIDNGEFEYAWLGISGTQLTRHMAEARGLPGDTRGALVVAAVQPGPAADAGLEGIERTRPADGGDAPTGGDVIVGIDGARITGMEDLIAYLLENTRPGDRVTLDVIREDAGVPEQVEATLGTRPGLDS